MTITPGTPDDWTDTEEPKRAEAFVERLPDGVGYNLRHYARIAHASHRMGEECHCRPSRIPHVTLAAPESARGGCMADFDAPQAPQEVPTPERPANPGPALPRPIEPADVRVGMVVERRKGEAAHRDRVHRIDGDLITGTAGAWVWVPGNAVGGWSLWLIEDAPQVDEDAALVEVMAEAVWRSVCGPHAQWPDGPGSPSDSDHWRESSRAAIVAARAAGYRIEAAR